MAILLGTPDRGGLQTIPGSLAILKQQQDPQETRGYAFARTNTFEGGTDATSITTGNSGGASGDAFGLIGGTNPTYSAGLHHGSGLSMSITSTSAGVASHVQWPGTGQLVGPIFLRAYVYLQQFPIGVDATIFYLKDSAGALVSRLRVKQTGTLVIIDGAAGTSGTVPLALGQWTRVEVCIQADPDGTKSGSTEFRLYNNAEAAIDQYSDRVVMASRSTGSGIDKIGFGWDLAAAAPADVVTWYYDDLGVSGQGWLGPTQPVPIIITQDPTARPLVLSGGIPRITGSMAILRPQEQGQDAVQGAAVAFAVPAASVTAASDTTVVLSTHQPAAASATAAGAVPAWPFAPAVASMTSTGQVPTLLDTHAPPVGAATAASPVPVLQSTYQPAVAAATAVGPIPTALVTFDQISVAPATVAAPAPAMVIVQEPYERPLTRLAGGIPRIPGSMAILRPQEPGPDPLPSTLFAVPVASVTAASDVTVMAMAILPAVASATSAGPTPALLITFLPAEGDATAAAPVPAMFFNVAITQDPSQVAMPGWGGLRRIPGSMAILRPQEWGDGAGAATLFAVPVANVTSTGLVPVMAMTFAAVVASATAAGATPVLSMTMATPVGAVTSASPVPVLAVSFLPTVGAASSAGLIPIIQATMLASVAAATSSAPVPTLRATFAPAVAATIATAPVPTFTAPVTGAIRATVTSTERVITVTSAESQVATSVTERQVGGASTEKPVTMTVTETGIIVIVTEAG